MRICFIFLKVWLCFTFFFNCISFELTFMVSSIFVIQKIVSLQNKRSRTSLGGSTFPNLYENCQLKKKLKKKTQNLACLLFCLLHLTVSSLNAGAHLMYSCQYLGDSLEHRRHWGNNSYINDFLNSTCLCAFNMIINSLVFYFMLE